MSIVLVGSTSGSITLQEPAVAGTTVLSLPATTGTVLTSASPSSDLPSSINGPSFRATANANQAFSSATFTKVQLQSETWDTANCFDNTTNYRFTPNVAGYYQINGTLCIDGTITRSILQFYKNGSIYSRPIDYPYSASRNYVTASDMVYLNGTTDYIELYVYAVGSNLNLLFPATGETSSFSAALVRGA